MSQLSLSLKDIYRLEGEIILLTLFKKQQD